MYYGKSEKDIYDSIVHLHSHRLWGERVAVHRAARQLVYCDDGSLSHSACLVRHKCLEHVQAEEIILI